MPSKAERLRRDRRKVLKARNHLLDRINQDVDFWYELVKQHAVTSERQQDPAVRMAMKMLDKLLSEQRDAEAPEQTTPPMSFQVYIGAGIERGTVEARATALQHQTRERIPGPNDVEADPIEIDPDDGGSPLRQAERLRDSVS